MMTAEKLTADQRGFVAAFSSSMTPMQMREVASMLLDRATNQDGMSLHIAAHEHGHGGSLHAFYAPAGSDFLFSGHADLAARLGIPYAGPSAAEILMVHEVRPEDVAPADGRVLLDKMLDAPAPGG